MANRNLEKYIESGKKRALGSDLDFNTGEMRELMERCKGDPWRLVVYALYVGIEAGYRIASKKQKG